MAKKKTNKSKSTRKKKPAKKDTKALAKKEYTDKEEARIAKYKKNEKIMPIKFKAAKSDLIVLQDPDDPFNAVKAFEALGTTALTCKLICLSK